MSKRALKESISSAIRARVFPGGVIVLGDETRTYLSKGFGRLSYDSDSPEPSPDHTLYDLASLTKPLVTAAVACCLLEQGTIGLEVKLSALMPNTANKEIGETTLRQLLSHTSGLPAWKPLYKDILQQGLPVPSARSRKVLLDLVLSQSLEYPPGSRKVYSDLDYILLGRVLEIAGQAPLDVLAQKFLFKPLKVERAAFFNLLKQPVHIGQVAPTENCPWRNRVLAAEVHDENAWVAGGVEGHAGLFATASSVLELARAWLAGIRGFGPLKACANDFMDKDTGAPLGWDVPCAEESQAGAIPGPKSAFGHLGFTGTSVWISAEKRLVAVLLTNRVHPDRLDRGIKEARKNIHDALWNEVDDLLSPGGTRI